MAYPVVPLIPAGNESLVSSAILQNAATSDGNGTDYDITGMATVQLLVNPTSYTGTVTFWSSIDGTTFVKIKGNQVDTTTIADNVANPGSTASLWTFNTGALTKIRAVLTSSGGTSVTVTGAASPVPNSCPLGVTLSSAVLAAGTAVIGTVKVGDGTTPAQTLAIDSSGRLTLVPNQVVELGDGTTPTQKLAIDSAGNASINIGKVGGIATNMAGSDGVTSTNVQEIAIGAFNGTTTDQLRTNVNTAALVTATGATTTQTGADQTNINGRGLIVVLDMTVNAGGSGSVTLTIQGKDAASGKYYTLLAGAAVVSVVTNVYTVYPGAPVTTNVSANAPLPRTWRVLATANNANATTYTVGASVIV